jgi:hypothetical protein
VEESLHELEQMRNRYLDEPLKQMRTWTTVALVCVCLGFGLIAAGAVGAVLKYLTVSVGVLTSLASLVTSAVATLFYKKLGSEQEILSKQLEDLRDDIKHTWDKTYKLAS